MSLTLVKENYKMDKFRPSMDVVKAGKLLGLPMDNLLNVDEDMLRAFFVDAQDKANQSTRKPKVDVRELHEAYQVIATLIRRNRMMIMNGHEEE